MDMQCSYVENKEIAQEIKGGGWKKHVTGSFKCEHCGQKETMLLESNAVSKKMEEVLLVSNISPKNFNP